MQPRPARRVQCFHVSQKATTKHSDLGQATEPLFLAKINTERELVQESAHGGEQNARCALLPFSWLASRAVLCAMPPCRGHDVEQQVRHCSFSIHQSLPHYVCVAQHDHHLMPPPLPTSSTIRTQHRRDESGRGGHRLLGPYVPKHDRASYSITTIYSMTMR